MRALPDLSAVPADFDLSPSLEAVINDLARDAKHNAAARNALYWLLAFKLARFCGPLRRRWLVVGDIDEMGQEAFLVYVQLVDDWTGAGSFARFFLGFARFRLLHVVERWERRARRAVPLDESAAGAAADDLTGVDLLAGLGPLGLEEAELLRVRVVEDLPIEVAAGLLHLSERTAFRRWGAVRGRLGPKVERETA